jgi:hypothetical protein
VTGALNGHSSVKSIAFRISATFFLIAASLLVAPPFALVFPISTGAGNSAAHSPRDFSGLRTQRLNSLIFSLVEPPFLPRAAGSIGTAEPGHRASAWHSVHAGGVR